MEKMKIDLPMSIPAFYKGKSIFLTGFSGALGKVLVEKLLYSCPELDTIYVLIRPKKGQTPQQRVDQVLTSRAFMRLRERYPGMLESKVVGVAGDMMEERLGLSQEDEQLLRREVSIILHGAASVRFDDPLDFAVRINTLGAKRMVDLALTMPRLVCLTYISTAYTNCDHLHIKEEMYPPKADWRKTIEVCEKINNAALEPLVKKYIDTMPNTYTFSKSLAEQVINDYKDQIPVIVVRPSIVVSSAQEPMIGWVDNKYGPIGTAVGSMLGLLRVSYFDEHNLKLNTIPSDIVVNAVIAATWKTALTRGSEAVKESVTVYNACCPESCLQLTAEGTRLYKDEEVARILRKDKIINEYQVFCGSELSFRINSLYRQFLPSFIIDLLLILKGIKPMMVNIRAKIHAATLHFHRFTFNTFTFEMKNFEELLEQMKQQDREEFGWNLEMYDIHRNGLIRYNNLKHTILKPFFDDPKTNSKRLRMLYIVDRFAVYLTYSLVGFFLYFFNIPSVLLSTAIRLLTFP